MTDLEKLENGSITVFLILTFALYVGAEEFVQLVILLLEFHHIYTTMPQAYNIVCISKHKFIKQKPFVLLS